MKRFVLIVFTFLPAFLFCHLPRILPAFGGDILLLMMASNTVLKYKWSNKQSLYLVLLILIWTNDFMGNAP